MDKPRPNRDLLVEHGYEESVEFIEYNTIRALPYIPQHPIVMYPLKEE